MIGVFGGSGFYGFLDDVELVEVDTPFGPPAAPVAIGSIGETKVAFLPRHGARHRFPPHTVPYRANVWALRTVGCRAVIGPFAAGSLRADIAPGELVVVDQLVDRTWGRPDTFHDEFEHGPVHIEMGEPYDSDLRAALVAGARSLDFPVHDGGTVVVVQGPRFSTRAESRWFASNGWDVVNMTQHPEAALAMEAGLPFAGVALVTDYDSGVDGVPHVTQDAVFAVFEANLSRLRDLLFTVIPNLA
ncbi:MAG: S-methyl-5'-thioadenosine phosphorylase [Acidobacteria bacterium]|nr:S-methyl-5'-thioadenosine phosphorylase [Acidobacteriota bacterium]